MPFCYSLGSSESINVLPLRFYFAKRCPYCSVIFFHHYINIWGTVTFALSLIGNTTFSFIILLALVTDEITTSDASDAATLLAVFICHWVECSYQGCNNSFWEKRSWEEYACDFWMHHVFPEWFPILFKWWHLILVKCCRK